jgi:hypothetical protein
VASDDELPSQDPGVTASVNGKALRGLLNIIARERARYVGIVASDPLDKIFLVSTIRDVYPDVQIFTTSADSLLTLPDFGYYLRGTFIVSTYPLLPEIQRWTAPALTGQSERRFAFASQTAQGYFNAVLAQLNNPAAMIGYGPPCFQACERCSTRRLPPIWITMVGQSGEFVPLKLRTDYGQDKDDVRKYLWPPNGKDVFLPAGEVIDWPFPYTALVGWVGVMVVCGFVLLRAFRVDGPQLFWEGDPVPQDRGQWLETYAYRFVCVVALLIFVGPATWLWLILRDANESPGVWRWGWALTSLCTFGLLAWPLVRPWLYWPDERQGVASTSPQLREGINALVAALCLAYVVLAARFLRLPLDADRAVLVERCLSFTSGASPLMPLLFMCATFFLWAFFQLRRIHLSVKFGVSVPYPESSQVSVPLPQLGRIQDLGAKLDGELKSSARFLRNHWRKFVVLSLLVALGAASFAGLYLPVPEVLPEALWVSWLFFTGFTLGFFLTAVNLLRFWTTWSHLRHLLNQIVLLPMTGAFDRLPYKVTALFGGYFFPGRPRLSHLAIPVQQLNLLRDETDRLLPTADARPAVQAVARELTDFQRDIDMIIEGYRKATSDDPGEQVPEIVLCKLSELARRLLTVLPRFWVNRPLNDGFGRDPKAGGAADESAQDTADPMARWVGLAEDFVATHVVLYISQFFVQLHNQVWSMIICSLLLLLGSTAYPFNIAHLILLSVLGLLAAVVVSIVVVLCQMNVNELVSRVTGTRPHHFTLDTGFVASFFTFVVPTVAVVAIQLSGSFRYLIEPVLRVFK